MHPSKSRYLVALAALVLLLSAIFPAQASFEQDGGTEVYIPLLMKFSSFDATGMPTATPTLESSLTAPAPSPTATSTPVPQFRPNDPLYPVQWNLQPAGSPGAGINAPEAWAMHTGSAGVTLAVVSTGIRPDLPDLDGRLLDGWLPAGDSLTDYNGWGTYLASVAAARGNNGVDMAGVAWQVKVLPVKVLDEAHHGKLSSIKSGIQYAVDQGARVILLDLNLSGSDNATIEELIGSAAHQGALLVAPAGNCGGADYLKYACSQQNQVSYPGASAHVLAVAATAKSGELADFSSRGAWVDVTAPGEDILGAWWDGQHVTRSRSEAAAAQVAGLVALVYSKYPAYNADQAAQAVLCNAERPEATGCGGDVGCGRIHAGRTLRFGAPQQPCFDWQKAY